MQILVSQLDAIADTGNAEVYFEELQEADLTDKQVKMVRKVADKLLKMISKNDMVKTHNIQIRNCH